MFRLMSCMLKFSMKLSTILAAKMRKKQVPPICLHIFKMHSRYVEQMMKEFLIFYASINRFEFQMVNDRHDELLSEAQQKEPPEIRLNVEVIEGKELQPKDPNGMSDPFVTMYIASSPTHRYNTSVKSGTLNPMWEEHFSL